jgi:hypothetical protein
MKSESPSIEALAAEEVAAMTPTKAPKGISEEEISAKVAAGLTRDQAVEVLTRQAAEDAAAAPKGKGKTKADA